MWRTGRWRGEMESLLSQKTLHSSERVESTVVLEYIHLPVLSCSFCRQTPDVTLLCRLHFHLNDGFHFVASIGTIDDRELIAS